MTMQEIPAMEENKVDKIMEYIMNTPENTNPAILRGMLEGLAFEGGDGGDSDFSTAQVTLIAGSKKSGTDNSIYNAIIISDVFGIMPTIVTAIDDDPRTYTFVLYQGEQFIELLENNIESISGSIEPAEDGYLIKGDCTITLYTASAT